MDSTSPELWNSRSMEAKCMKKGSWRSLGFLRATNCWKETSLPLWFQDYSKSCSQISKLLQLSYYTYFPLLDKITQLSSMVSALISPIQSASRVIGFFFELPWIQFPPSSKINYPPVCSSIFFEERRPPALFPDYRIITFLPSLTREIAAATPATPAPTTTIMK